LISKSDSPNRQREARSMATYTPKYNVHHALAANPVMKVKAQMNTFFLQVVILWA
jgi:hypothetical protein